MKAPKRNKLLISIGTLASIILIYFIYEHIRYVETDNAQIDAHWVMLAPRVAGYIKFVGISEGQKVKKDDVLIEIDDRDYQSELNQAKANLQSIQAKMKDTEKNFRRVSELFNQSAVSNQQYDTAHSNYLESQAKYQSLAAQVAQAEINLENTSIKAPFDGFIAKKSVEVGQLASPGVPLVGFVSSTDRWISGNFKETDIENIKIGAKVDASVDALGGSSFYGHVDSISSATGSTFALLPPDNATGNFTKVVQRVPVKIKLDNLTPEEIEILRVGLSVVVKVHK